MLTPDDGRNFSQAEEAEEEYEDAMQRADRAEFTRQQVAGNVAVLTLPPSPHLTAV